MIKNHMFRIACFAATFFAISVALDYAFGYSISFPKEAVEAAAVTAGWLLAVRWAIGRTA